MSFDLLDKQLAVKLQEMDTSHRLPFFHPGHATLTPTPGTVRIKSASYATNKERFHNANSNLISSAGPSASTGLKVKTVIWRPLKNCKILYDDRHKYGLV